MSIHDAASADVVSQTAEERSAAVMPIAIYFIMRPS